MSLISIVFDIYIFIYFLIYLSIYFFYRCCKHKLIFVTFVIMWAPVQPMVRTVSIPEVLTCYWCVYMQMHPFLSFLVLMLCNMYVKFCCLCVSWLVALLFWKFVVSVCECEMCTVWLWYEMCLGMLSDMVIGTWTKLNSFTFSQNIDILFFPYYGFEI